MNTKSKAAAARHFSDRTPSDETYPPFQRAFDLFNRELFEGRLPQVLLTLQRQPRTCGYFSPNRFANRAGAMTHELAMNPEYFAITPLVESLQTLVHEMVHLWQLVFGTPARGRFHNREWGDKMEAIGLMPSSTGKPGGKRTGDHMADYPIEGGRFMRVVKQLVDEDFTIAWYDRFPPAQKNSEPPHPVLATVNGVPLPSTATVAPADSGIVATVPRPTNSSNRLKYQCDGCKSNVWGKPGLSITCNTCGQLFKAKP